MSGNIDLNAIARRLERIEQRFSILDDLITHADPPPEDLGRWGRPDLAELLSARLGDLIKHLRPGLGGDPAPDDIGRFGRGELASNILNLRLSDLLRGRLPGRHGDPPPRDFVRANAVEARLRDILSRNPGWFSDPPPEDFLNVRILDLIRRWRGGFTDPAPDDISGVRLRDLLQRVPGGGFSDPPPDDISRLTKSEIESQLHRVNAEMVRLKSFERLLTDRLGKLSE